MGFTKLTETLETYVFINKELKKVANMTTSIGDTVQMMYSDDQTGIVIPENHMLMQAMLFGKSYNESFTHTESIFRMNEKKQKLEEYFSKKD